MRPRAGLTYRYPHKAEPYAEAMRQAGIEPVLLSPENPRTLAGLRGLLLSGGTDVNPERYGEAPRGDNEPPDDARDQMEAAMLAEALAADLPILAICRGMQLFNVAHGGTLIQHLDNFGVHQVVDIDHALPVHLVQVEQGSRLASIQGQRVEVNSRHHQAVDRVGAGLRVTARSTPDGVIEALERDDRRFVVAVQWHPEDQAPRDAVQRKLFEAFGAALG